MWPLEICMEGKKDTTCSQLSIVSVFGARSNWKLTSCIYQNYLIIGFLSFYIFTITHKFIKNFSKYIVEIFFITLSIVEAQISFMHNQNSLSWVETNQINTFTYPNCIERKTLEGKDFLHWWIYYSMSLMVTYSEPSLSAAGSTIYHF